jgi:glycine betaine catabolism B
MNSQKFNLLTQRFGDGLDHLLDSLTTYRLVLYLLIIYFAGTLLLDLSGQYSFGFFSIIFSAVFLLLVCRLTNWAMSKWLKIPHNHESDLVTALILSLILTPAASAHGYLVLAVAAVASQLSKYLLAWHGRHFFNPAALGAYLPSLILGSYASWWVGSRAMAPLLIVGGLLIARKMKRFQMLGAFFFIYIGYVLLNAQPLHSALLATPVIFFATIMLTEPLTSPTKLDHSLIYAGGVALLYSITKLHVAPEAALLIGNLVTFGLNPNRSLILNFVRQQKEADGIYSYFFRAAKKFNFKAGQYMEWTVPGVQFDGRGNRRYITIASAPTEENIMFTLRVPDKPSSFKSSLTKLRHGDVVLAAQLAGSFTLPDDTARPLVWLAGGIGVTPFRSMAKALLDSQQSRQTELLYFVNHEGEIAFGDLFEQAKTTGLKCHFIVKEPSERWRGPIGAVTPELIKQLVPSAKDKLFYISGPQGFVAAARQILTGQGVSPDQIKTDFFPGYN